MWGFAGKVTGDDKFDDAPDRHLRAHLAWCACVVCYVRCGTARPGPLGRLQSRVERARGAGVVVTDLTVGTYWQRGPDNKHLTQKTGARGDT